MEGDNGQIYRTERGMPTNNRDLDRSGNAPFLKNMPSKSGVITDTVCLPFISDSNTSF